MAVVKQITKKIKNGFAIIWKIATLQYLLVFMVSNPIKFLLYSPAAVPLALVAAFITICTSGGIAFVVSGLLVLAAIPLSGPLTCAALISCLCYIVYKACLAVVNYTCDKTRTLYADCCRVKEMMKAAPGHIIIFIVGIYEKASHMFCVAYQQFMDKTRTTVQYLRDLRDTLNIYSRVRVFFGGVRQKCSRNFRISCLQLWAKVLMRLQRFKQSFVNAPAASCNEKVASELKRECRQVNVDKTGPSNSKIVKHDPRPSASGLQNTNLTKREDAPTVRRGLPPPIVTRENVREMMKSRQGRRRYLKSHSYVHVDTSPRSREF